jgi:phosphomevalonate kinase
VKVIAPGKLVLTGAYAVLEGAPAIVVAVDRYAEADTELPGKIDVRPLYDDAGKKLGLGSSAASLVASLGARAVARGEDPRNAAVRADLFRAARAAHAREQGGGSGVDVAASVHGGALRYTIDRTEPSIRAVDWPSGLVLSAFWSGTSARTSDLLARVDALRVRGGAGGAPAFVRRAAAFGRALAVLGEAADAAIVPPPFAELALLAEREGGAFLPSGAGGGDVGIWLGTIPPPASVTDRATALSLSKLSLAVDHGGVRPASPS